MISCYRPFSIRFATYSLLPVCLMFLIIQLPSIAGPTEVIVDGSDTGRAFDGIGALSAGASSRLLIDYPEKQRSEILDYLFKPDFGAGLQINKVEIGGDANSTDGAEPSNMRTPTDQNNQRGYEWWLMVESKKRNPKEQLYVLEWTAPNWINPAANNVWTPANNAYIINFLNHAKSDYGLTIDYAGGWNERGFDKAWYIGYRNALNDAGYQKVKVVGDDSFSWTVGKEMVSDPAFNSSIDIIGQHYPDSSPAILSDTNFQAALQTGKPIWFSEMGSQGYDSGADNLAKQFNQSYIDNRATANINWSTIWSVYAALPYSGCGLMLADEPWTGHYYVGKSIWACAHTTQFVQPGWQYLDQACGFLGGKYGSGSYVTLKSPNGKDFSIVIETIDAHTTQTLNFGVAGGLSTGPIHMWSTDMRSKNQSDWFVKESDLGSANGKYSVALLPGYLYSLTTTTGQAKGKTDPPKSKVLSFPYRDTFAQYAAGENPKYFSDQQGRFEVASATGGRMGNCVRQVITSNPILWAGNGDPSTLFGDPRWTDYAVSSDVLLEQPGYVDLIGRMQNISTTGNSNVINGYHLRLSSSGDWSLQRMVGLSGLKLSSGTVPCSVGSWHTLKLQFSGMRITAWIDGKQVAFVNNADFRHGLAGYQVSSWQNAEFQNLLITKAPSGPEPTIEHPLSATATSANDGFGPENAVDGDIATLWHTRYEPTLDKLPQSITVDLGAMKTFDTVNYQPRSDGNQNGDITQYVIEVSSDGVAFKTVDSGTWADDSNLKESRFAAVTARYVRLTALQGHGGYACAAEIDTTLINK